MLPETDSRHTLNTLYRLFVCLYPSETQSVLSGSMSPRHVINTRDVPASEPPLFKPFLGRQWTALWDSNRVQRGNWLWERKRLLRCEMPDAEVDCSSAFSFRAQVVNIERNAKKITLKCYCGCFITDEGRSSLPGQNNITVVSRYVLTFEEFPHFQTWGGKGASFFFLF